MNRQKAQNDEFYTPLNVVEKGLQDYKKQLKGKNVYCPCDDYRTSNFVKYFRDNFDALGIRSLTATTFNKEGRGTKYVLKENGKHYTKRLQENGSFNSDECIRLLEKSDVVITNPPYSLKEEFISLVLAHKKKILVLCPQNTVTNKSIAELFRKNQLWFSRAILSGGTEFEIPSSYKCTARQNRFEDGKQYVTFSGIKWITNLKSNRKMPEYKTGVKYRKENYSKYDNYDAINIDQIKDIPDNYYKPMGVPITFLVYCDPKFFTILRIRKGSDGKDLRVNGKDKFMRFVIQRKKQERRTCQSSNIRAGKRQKSKS